MFGRLCHGVGGGGGLGRVVRSSSDKGGLWGGGTGTSAGWGPTLAVLMCDPLWPCRVCERAHPLPPPPLQQCSHTHTPAVLSRLLWDATAAQLPFCPSLPPSHIKVCTFSLISLSVFSFFFSPAFLSGLPRSLSWRPEEDQETVYRQVCLLLPFLFPSLLMMLWNGFDPPATLPISKDRKRMNWQLRNSLSSFKSKSALPPHTALILFPFPCI